VQAPVRERETERERLPFTLPANGTPVQPPVQVASFVTFHAGCVCLGASSGRSNVWSHVRYSPVCRVRSFTCRRFRSSDAVGHVVDPSHLTISQWEGV